MSDVPGTKRVDEESKMSELADTFAAPCFETIEEFGFHFHCWDAYGYPASEEYTSIVDVITSKMSLLRTIMMTMPFHLAWCSQFANLIHLEYIEWGIFAGDHEDPAKEEDVIETFNSAFADKVDMPILKFVPPHYPNYYDTRGEVSSVK